jgi:indolepyruvate ferredoxin oxidoreductase
VVNSHEIVTGDFTRNTDSASPARTWRLALQARLRGLSLFDASELARKLLGDTIFTNRCFWARPGSAGSSRCREAAILKAMELNGAAVERNKQAFEMGRWAIVNPEVAASA